MALLFFAYTIILIRHNFLKILIADVYPGRKIEGVFSVFGGRNAEMLLKKTGKLHLVVIAHGICRNLYRYIVFKQTARPLKTCFYEIIPRGNSFKKE